MGRRRRGVGGRYMRVPAANLGSRQDYLVYWFPSRQDYLLYGTKKVKILTGIWRSGRGEGPHCSNRGEDGAARLEHRANAYVDVCNIMRNACRKTPAGGFTSAKRACVLVKKYKY